MKSPYELRANDEDEERGPTPSDDEDEGDDKSYSSSDSINSDGGHGDDDSNTNSDDNNNKNYDSLYSNDDWGELPSERDVDYYDQDIEDDIEANRWSDTDSDQYRLINVLENA